jgi:hypothetical protein
MRVFVCVIKTNLMQYLSSVYFVNQPLHVSGISVAHHQEVYCIYTTIGTCCSFQLTVCWPGWDGTSSISTHLLYIYSIPPDDGLQICPKRVEVDWRNKQRINGASSWFLLHRIIEMHGQQNIKFSVYLYFIGSKLNCAQAWTSWFILRTKYYSGDPIKGGSVWRGMWYVRGKREVHTRFWWGKLEEGVRLE